MNESIITWNVTNWVTVVVMVFLGFTIFAVVSQTLRGLRARNSAVEN
jgi:hypothetical protein